MFVGLNPSTADESADDPTIRRCVRFARDWGFDGLFMVNLFAYRATQPADMLSVDDAVGPENDEWLVRIGAEAGLVVAAWGNHGAHQSRDKAVRRMFPNINHLGLTAIGQPRHPLYLRSDELPTLWVG